MSNTATNDATGKTTNQQIAAMHKPPVVSADEWQKSWEELLVKEKELTRTRDAMAAARRRMPWLAVEKDYVFEGPEGKRSLLDLFEGRRQLVLYRAFYDDNVYGWPDHACVGCSLGADQVSNLAHLHARDTTLAYASRGSQENLAKLKHRMGWEKIPWYTITDDWDKDFSVDQWHGHNVFFRDETRQDLPHLLREQPRRRKHGHPLELPRRHAPRPPGRLGRLPRRLPQRPALQVVALARCLRPRRSRVGQSQRRRHGYPEPLTRSLPEPCRVDATSALREK